MNNKLIIKFKRIENDVFASPINIPDWAKGITISYPENRYKFSSYISQPHHLVIKEVLLYIPPTFYEMNFTPRCRFDDAKEAENWINYMNNEIEKLNEEHNMIMKNEKLAFDIGTFENIVIIKLIDVPSVSYSAEAREEFDLIDGEKATVYIAADLLAQNRSMVFDYSYSNVTGDNWKIIIPNSKKAVDVKAKALTFSDAFKAAQFVKCFKKAVAKVNSQIEPPIAEEKSIIEWERCE